VGLLALFVGYSQSCIAQTTAPATATATATASCNDAMRYSVFYCNVGFAT